MDIGDNKNNNSNWYSVIGLRCMDDIFGHFGIITHIHATKACH